MSKAKSKALKEAKEIDNDVPGKGGPFFKKAYCATCGSKEHKTKDCKK